MLGQNYKLVNRIVKPIGYGLAIVLSIPLVLILIHLADTYGALMLVAHYVPWRDNIADFVVFRVPTRVLDNTAALGNDKNCAVSGNRALTIPSPTYAK